MQRDIEDLAAYSPDRTGVLAMLWTHLQDVRALVQDSSESGLRVSLWWQCNGDPDVMAQYDALMERVHGAEQIRTILLVQGRPDRPWDKRTEYGRALRAILALAIETLTEELTGELTEENHDVA